MKDLTKKQEQIYRKCKNKKDREQKIKNYGKTCIEANSCPHCGCLLRFVSGVLEDACCAGNTVFMGVYICSSSKCNFCLGNGDRDNLAEWEEWIDGKKLLSKEEKRRIRIAEKIDETYWAAPISGEQ
ncbi:MAG: hypothetical protein ACXAC5_03325 [Promethearchaeota archaeon]|jgi:hypothetical protein